MNHVMKMLMRSKVCGNEVKSPVSKINTAIYYCTAQLFAAFLFCYGYFFI